MASLVRLSLSYIRFTYMIRYLLIFSVCATVLACSNPRRKDLSRDAVGSMEELIESFDVLTLPLAFPDTLLRKNDNDSLLMGKANFLLFFPDTALKRVFGKITGFPKLYALGRLPVKEEETYLFMKAVRGKKRALFVFVIDKNKKYTVSMHLLVDDEDPTTTMGCGIDRKFTFTLTKERKSGDELFYTNSSYYYTTAGEFMLAAINTNEAPVNDKIDNPLDTLSRKMKWGGDYYWDRKNLVSVRDGRTEKERQVFILLNRNDGSCRGEIKGVAVKLKEQIFQLAPPGDPCSIELFFSGKSVQIKELTGCGNHRDMDCAFDGQFHLRREARGSSKKSASAKK